MLIVSFAALLAMVAAVAVFLYRNQETWLVDTARRAMTSGNRARAAEILAWRDERLADGQALRSDAPFRELSHELAGDSPRAASGEAWDQHVALILTRRDYVGAALVTADGSVRRAVGKVSPTRLAAGWSAVASNSLAVVLSDPVPADAGHDEMVLWVALGERGEAPGRAPAVALAINPEVEFAPLLRGRTVPNSSTQNCLVRAVPGGLIFLGGASAGIATGRRLATAEAGTVGARIASRQAGQFDGYDLAGLPAIGAARPVGDTGWWMVSTITLEGIGGGASEGWRVALIVALIVVAGGATLLLVWQRKQAALYRALYQAEVDRKALAESMERQLRESAERYRLLFESANDAIVLADAVTGEILDVNRKATELVGRSADELRGRHHTEMHPPGDRDKAMANLRARLTGEKRDSLAAALYSSDGREIPVEVNASRIDLQGRPVILGIFRDQTERLAAEAALRRSEETYRVAAEQTGQLLFDIDAESERVEWRGAIETLTGFTPEEYATVDLPGWVGFVHPADRDTVRAKFDRALATMSEFRAEYRYRRKDGSYFLAEDHGVCLPSGDGRHLRMIGTMRDVTATHAAEEELHQSETRRQKLESLALLAGGIAHDFNNLLTGILGNISLAVQDTRPATEAHACLLEAERASVRAQELTRQLLTFSRGGAPIKKIVDLAGLVRDTTLFACRGTAVRCEVLLPDEPISAEVDEGQVSQVVNNISINAVQAMPAGGVLTAAVGLVSLGHDNPSGLPPGLYARITLADTGIGIPPTLLARVFDPYFTTKQQGSGLGLAISHSIVLRHGGAIGVRSQAGQGTEFEVLLPATRERPPDRAGAADIAFEGGGRVLVMDDEEQVRELALRMVARLGFEGHGVRDGEAAVTAYREALSAGQPFDLVVMDLTVTGGMGGKDAVRGVLALDPAARVIVSSGYSNDPVMAFHRQYGFAAVLAKPYRMGQMRETFAQVLGAKAAES
jgi:two-component system, cell cycle sensor histidine kinase and response regulator CckA